MLSRFFLIAILLITFNSLFMAEAQYLLLCPDKDSDCKARCIQEECGTGHCRTKEYSKNKFHLCFCEKCPLEHHEAHQYHLPELGPNFLLSENKEDE